MSTTDESFRDRISTVNEKGNRVWIFPKKPKGPYYNKRKILSYFFLAFLFGAPHVNIGGEPLLLFNIIERKFVIFGKVFWPQDMYLFALMIIVGVVFVILFTIIYGRLFCGWVCPQTIFMEMVFRRVEYLIDGDWTEQKRLTNSPWTKEKIFKRTLKHIVFWGISFLIANTFLAYIIGAQALWDIQTDPVGEHLGGLIAIAIFTSVFYGVFAFLREQVCTTICPYGRLQGVLLDKNSMVVAYDHVRGEGRAKVRKGEDRKAAGKGDCIDCHQCVHVCPTGIDIRNGTQLECINCTACMDACDTMMDAVGLEKGLVRFVSENGIKERTPFVWTKRVISYTVVLAGLMLALTILLLTRKDFETNVIRQRGSTYQITDEGRISNIYEVNILNKTKYDYKIVLKSDDKSVEVIPVKENMVLYGGKSMKERILVKLNNEQLENGLKKIEIKVYGNGRHIQTIKTKFIGPMM
jgi:cytochrome c oxidase accessory protein FixG